jgi:hypothetical protein
MVCAASVNDVSAGALKTPLDMSCAAVFLPLHVVLSEHGPECEVRLLAPQVLRAAGLTPAVSIPAHRTLRRIREVLISIGACSTKRAYEGRPVVEIEATEESFQEEATGV